MWLGAGIDIVIDKVKVDALSFEIPLIGTVDVFDGVDTTLYTRVPLTPIIGSKSVPKILDPLLNKLGLKDASTPEASAAEAVILVSQNKGMTTIPEAMKTTFRLDLAKIADHLQDRMIADPDGTDSARNIPPLLGIKSSADSAFDRDDLAEYIDQPGPYETSYLNLPNINDPESNHHAVARAYNRSHALEWCEGAELSDLLALQDLAQSSNTQVMRDMCAEVASRHIRLGTDEADFDPDHVNVCDALLANAPFVYLDVDITEGLARQELGLIWCGCEELPEDHRR
jgi:hypothetical protein